MEQTLAAYCNNQNSNQERSENDNLKNGRQHDQERILNPELNSGEPILYQNVPNPFNVKTNIKYFVPEDSFGSLILIFDMQGTLLKFYELVTKGNSSLEISGNELKPGMYMYTLIYAGKEIDTRKMILTN